MGALERLLSPGFFMKPCSEKNSRSAPGREKNAFPADMRCAAKIVPSACMRKKAKKLLAHRSLKQSDVSQFYNSLGRIDKKCLIFAYALNALQARSEKTRLEAVAIILDTEGRRYDYIQGCQNTFLGPSDIPTSVSDMVSDIMQFLPDVEWPHFTWPHFPFPRRPAIGPQEGGLNY